jgi:hypothetical protein
MEPAFPEGHCSAALRAWPWLLPFLTCLVPLLTISNMSFQPPRVLFIAACLLIFPFRVPAPQVYRPGEGWIYEPAGGSSEFPRELELRPEVVSYDLESVSWNLAQRKGPFPKEPELSQRFVIRKLLQCGNDTNNVIALIWDQPKHKLYVDLNGNLDLTDDPAGVYSSTGKAFQQVFTNVTLPLKTATGLLPAIVDLHLSTDAQGSWAAAQLHAHSLWQAKVAFGGEDWQVAAVDNLFGPQGPAPAKFLLLRPLAARTNSVSLYDTTCGIVPFPSQLFWLGQAFRLERHLDLGGQTPVCKLSFTSQQPPLTDLSLSGESLYFAVLRDTNGYTAVFRGAPGTVKLPQGIYTVSAAWLKKGPAEAIRLGIEPLLVKATTATDLVLGGPLTNWVVLDRYGRKLSMRYQLKGADGGSYRLAHQDRTQPPEFTVYHGGKKALSGKFEFG